MTVVMKIILQSINTYYILYGMRVGKCEVAPV